MMLVCICLLQDKKLECELYLLRVVHDIVSDNKDNETKKGMQINFCIPFIIYIKSYLTMVTLLGV